METKIIWRFLGIGDIYKDGHSPLGDGKVGGSIPAFHFADMRCTSYRNLSA